MLHRWVEVIEEDSGQPEEGRERQEDRLALKDAEGGAGVGHVGNAKDAAMGVGLTQGEVRAHQVLGRLVEDEDQRSDEEEQEVVLETQKEPAMGCGHRVVGFQHHCLLGWLRLSTRGESLPYSATMIASKLRGWQQMNDRDGGQAKERVPPHQRVTSKLPTLTYGPVPRIDLAHGGSRSTVWWRSRRRSPGSSSWPSRR